MTRADRIAIGIALACALFGLGWKLREWTIKPKPHEYTLEELVAPTVPDTVWTFRIDSGCKVVP